MRAPKGQTFDPCHGCGQVPQHYLGRPKTGVCSNCQHTLQLAQRIAQDQAAAEMKVVGIPTQPHWLPYLSEAHDDAFNRTRPSIRDEFWKLAVLCSSPAIETSAAWPPVLVQPRSGESRGWSPARDEDKRLMPPAVADQFAALFEAIRLGLPAAYQDGKQRGQSLLGQLAAGEITANAFNDMAINGKR